MGGFPRKSPPKFKLFNLLSWTHEIFRVNKHKEKIKFDKILRYENRGIPLKRGHQKSSFLTTHARHMKFLEQMNIS